LIIVDGKESPHGMSSVDIQDVSNISVLKDASSTAVYGSKGKNGVILITTKKNATGSTSGGLKFRNELALKSNFTTSRIVWPPKYLELVDGKEVPTNFMQTVSEDDIESITLLKDTTATRLYGEKGKNGAILIKMKKK